MSRYEIHHGDAYEVLRTMPSDSVDAIVTDPPAGISFMSKKWDRDHGGRDAWVRAFAAIFAEALRVLKPGGRALVWSIPRTSHWTACGGNPAGSVEPSSQSTANTSTSVVKDGRSMGVAVPAIFAKSLRGIVCSQCGGKVAGSGHPTCKPQALMRWLCRLITPPSGVVLDCFAGSASTGVACMAEGFRFIGVEREPEYVEIARARMEDAAREPRQTALDFSRVLP